MRLRLADYRRQRRDTSPVFAAERATSPSTPKLQVFCTLPYPCFCVCRRGSPCERSRRRPLDTADGLEWSGNVQRSFDDRGVWRNKFPASKPEPCILWESQVDRASDVEASIHFSIPRRPPGEISQLGELA